MPPALHPRSNMTLSLFTTTLAVSFLVVGMPHILPCPVAPKALADSDPDAIQKRRRRRRKSQADREANAASPVEVEAGSTASCGQSISDDGRMGRRRECPVPKPSGLVGQLMGFKETEGRRAPPVVKVEAISRRKTRPDADEGQS